MGNGKLFLWKGAFLSKNTKLKGTYMYSSFPMTKSKCMSQMWVSAVPNFLHAQAIRKTQKGKAEISHPNITRNGKFEDRADVFAIPLDIDSAAVNGSMREQEQGFC